MSSWSLEEMQQEQRVDEFTKALLRFYDSEVRITKEAKAECKRLVREYVEPLMECCREISPLHTVKRLEYTGSMYEGLKAQAADEVDLMVVLETGTKVTVEYSPKKGFARFRATGYSILPEYRNRREGYISPDSFGKSIFFGLVVKEANKFNEERSESSGISFEVRHNGPAVQLDLIKKGKKLLSADLVACFKTENDEYFVPKSYMFPSIPNSELLWRQSFSLDEKKIFKTMDKKDNGCRRMLLRIVKTIVKREKPLAKLTSYHLKTAFMHYIYSSPEMPWDVSYLGKHFRGFLEELRAYLSSKERYFPHYFLPHVNLLKDIKSETIDDMANRLKKILSREAVLNGILCCTTQEAHGRVQSDTHHISLDRLITRQEDIVMQDEHIPVRMPQTEDRTQTERYRGPHFTMRQEEDVVQNEHIPFHGLLQVEDRTQTERYRCPRFMMRQREHVMQNEHIPLVTLPQIGDRTQIDREKYRVPRCRVRQEDVMQNEQIPLVTMPKEDDNLAPRPWERGKVDDRTQIDRERYHIPWCRMREEAIQNEHIPLVTMPQMDDRTQIDQRESYQIPRYTLRREDVMQNEQIPLVTMPLEDNNFVPRVSPRSWERGWVDDKIQIDRERYRGRMRQEDVMHNEHISLVRMPEVEDRTPMERYRIHRLGIPRLDDMTENDGNYISRFGMSQNAELEGTFQHRLECRCLTFVSRLVLKFVLGLISFSLGVVIFASWLAGIGILIILVWLGLSHLD